MKVAILGNSHVACLIMAHRQDPSLLGTDIDPVFFAAPGKGMSGMQLDGDRLVPASSELKDQIASRDTEMINSYPRGTSPSPLLPTHPLQGWGGTAPSALSGIISTDQKLRTHR